MIGTIKRIDLCCFLSGVLLLPGVVFANVPGVADGIPEPEQRNVIVQLFNWKFNDITAVIPKLKKLGYSHIHVSPPQKSNEHVWQWWGRYQPVDFSAIGGPLGSEEEFKQMIEVAHAPDNNMRIIVDTVLNHTVDVTEQPNPPFITLDGNSVVAERFPQFEPGHFHERCSISGPDTEQKCWLGEKRNLADLNTHDPQVRQVAKNYLKKLADLGVDGFRFDAAIHIEPEFYTEVLAVVPDKYAFGEIIKDRPSYFQAWTAIPALDFYDFPLAKTMREAFAPRGNLGDLKNPKAKDQALEGPKAVTFVRNHDIDRGQANDRGLDAGGRQTYGIGWDEGSKNLNRTDVHLAYAYILGREDGLPYVFVDMNTLPDNQQDDRYDDEFVVAGIRFHNLCLGRGETWRIDTQNTIGWQRGNDRFIVINKAAESYVIRELSTTLEPGEYQDVHTGESLQVQSGGMITQRSVPGRSAMMFVRVGN